MTSRSFLYIFNIFVFTLSPKLSKSALHDGMRRDCSSSRTSLVATLVQFIHEGHLEFFMSEQVSGDLTIQSRLDIWTKTLIQVKVKEIQQQWVFPKFL